MRFIKRKRAQVCLVSVDGTDFGILEPYPFDPKWKSHKFESAGMQYELTICINTGFIVVFNGPFACGSYNDRKIFNLCLGHELEEWEYIVGNKGYRGRKAPSGHHGYYDSIQKTVRSQHETVNHRLKQFSCLRERYRNSRTDHYLYFAPCILIVQIGIEEGNKIFQVEEYEEPVFIGRI